MKVEYEEIIIDWSSQTLIVNNQIPESVVNKKDCLYMIYGNHHIYGHTLLYIGKSIDAKRRLEQHLKSVFGYVNGLSIAFGEVKRGLESKRLEIPESILIANHKPAFNKEYIHTLDNEAMKEKIIIINNGDNGMLKTCCTNFWWVD
ncbi:MAG: hypothetical protein WDA74_12815 [Spirochaetota bacterium]